MKHWLVACLGILLLAGTAWGQSGDEEFVRLYNLIQQADTLNSSGQSGLAIARYREALAGLKRMQKAYPTWNQKIVKFRTDYVIEKLGPFANEETPLPTPANDLKTQTPPPVDPAEVELRMKNFQERIQRLQDEKQTMEAKLREALTAQPAALDPRELRKAEDQIKTLQKEVDVLRVNLEQEQAKQNAVDPKALEGAQKALEESNRRVKLQAEALSILNTEKEVLKTRLQSISEYPNAAAIATENESLRRQIQELQAKAIANTTGKDTAQKLEQAQAELKTQTERNEVLQAERTLLERRLQSLTQETAEQRKLNEQVATLQASLTVAQQQVTQLSNENQTLQTKLAVAISALATRPDEATVTKFKVDNERLNQELEAAQARLATYEAKKEPYTPEELALFKTPSTPPIAPVEPVVKKSITELPAGASGLIAEAQRATEAKQLSDAETKYLEVLKLDGQNVFTLSKLASLQMEQGKTAEAEASLNRALALDAQDAYSLSLYGILKYRQANYDVALDALSKAAQADPKNAETQNYLGVTLSQKGMRAPAETALRKSIQLSPGYAVAHHNLAVVYATQKPPFLELSRWHYAKAIAAGHAKNEELEKYYAELK